ncbi:hypothetical protein KC341_g70 [Hortaea werneckii]|nr:hypothetical protein KC341_g70 [Hortaea werneckii]
MAEAMASPASVTVSESNLQIPEYLRPRYVLQVPSHASIITGHLLPTMRCQAEYTLCCTTDLLNHVMKSIILISSTTLGPKSGYSSYSLSHPPLHPRRRRNEMNPTRFSFTGEAADRNPRHVSIRFLFPSPNRQGREIRGMCGSLQVLTTLRCDAIGDASTTMLSSPEIAGIVNILNHNRAWTRATFKNNARIRSSSYPTDHTHHNAPNSAPSSSSSSTPTLTLSPHPPHPIIHPLSPSHHKQTQPLSSRPSSAAG